MTAIKLAGAVKSARHWTNACDYVSDERAIARDTLNIANPHQWQREMESTRAAYGHDQSGRVGVRPTLAYHEVIAFLPDECDMHGGLVTAERAMGYAREYISRAYPNQEAALALHDEGGRWAVHAVINRTDLETGRRHDRNARARHEMHEVQHEMDERYGLLADLERGKHYSRVQGRSGHTRETRAIEARGEHSWKLEAARQIAQAAQASRGARDFSRELTERGISLTVPHKGAEPVYTVAGYESTPLSASRLSAHGIDRAALTAAWRERAAHQALTPTRRAVLPVQQASRELAVRRLLAIRQERQTARERFAQHRERSAERERHRSRRDRDYGYDLSR